MTESDCENLKPVELQFLKQMKERPRVLALDVGDKRIGVAVSDRTGMLVTPVETIHRKNMKADVARVATSRERT